MAQKPAHTLTDGVFGSDDAGGAEFRPALDLRDDDVLAVQTKTRRRGLRWLHRHGHLDDIAVHTLDSPDHAGGWSVDASVTIPDWDRHGLERLVRYCARPPQAQLGFELVDSPAGQTAWPEIDQTDGQDTWG